MNRDAAVDRRNAVPPVVFLGPTLPVAEARAVLEADYRPPAAQGDLYRAALDRPPAICLVDGYFSRVPAVWHKEVLWAMQQGVHVFGSSSMGALRAAELDTFGMVGVGRVYEAYRDGELEADDEVAVAHGPAESGYRAVSDALVNIRATLGAAVADGAVSAKVAGELVEVARGLFYPDRSYPQLLEAAAARGIDPAEISELRSRLPELRVDRKRLDALELLRTVDERLRAGLEPKDVEYSVADSQVWARARALSGGARTGDDGADFAQVTEELRLLPGRPQTSAYRAAYKEALLRHLMLAEADRARLTPAPEEVEAAGERLLTALGGSAAPSAAVLDRWAREQARLRLVEARHYTATLSRLPDHLHVSGLRSEVAEAAAHKSRLVAERLGRLPSAAEAGFDEEELLRWFFHERRGEPVPADVAAHARAAGFGSTEEFRRALVLDRLAHPSENDTRDHTPDHDGERPR
ncbi:TfuA-like protein [Nocardiopsis exhalans]|uniref:TfuA-like protein n=1 Tax=Nocardiopsis exhalans TaxID=163604 RepID=A0ABY5D307_9ACTN|nr:TfuA-like protein [Nocardiopsis exhalans]USY17240.1 TfuA-like protein [Nocardiopsis exhalans]